MVGLELVHFRPQEFAALTIFRDHNRGLPPVASRPKFPSPILDGRNRVVLRQFPARPVGVDSADMMNAVVGAGSVGFVHATNLNVTHTSAGFLLKMSPRGGDMSDPPVMDLNRLNGCEVSGGRRRPRLPSVGFLEFRRLFRTGGRVSGAIGMGAGARKLAAVDDQIFFPDRATLEPALENLARSGGVARLR
jgi:hypothetical protein